MNARPNIVLIHGFKEYCAFLFFKGALLKDPKGILIQQTENVQSARQVRFADGTSVDAHTISLATGVTYRQLAAPGLDGLTGRGVYY